MRGGNRLAHAVDGGERREVDLMEDRRAAHRLDRSDHLLCTGAGAPMDQQQRVWRGEFFRR